MLKPVKKGFAKEPAKEPVKERVLDMDGYGWTLKGRKTNNEEQGFQNKTKNGGSSLKPRTHQTYVQRLISRAGKT